MPIYKMGNEKRDGLQKYRVRINYQDSEGKNRQIDRVAWGNDQAKDLESQLRQSIKKERLPQSKRLKDIFDEYINVKSHEVRESSLDKTKTILTNHVLATFEKTYIDRINLQKLQEWKLYIEGKNLSITMKRNIFGEFRAFMNYAIKMEYIHKNPLTKLGNFKSAYETKSEMGYYTSDEFLKFISAVKKGAVNSEKTVNSLNEWHYYVFFCIAFYTGLRKGEIHGLQWNDIKDKYLSVKRSISQKLKGADRETPPKNQTSYRTLQMPKPLMEILNAHKKRCETIEDFNDNCKICGIFEPLRDTTINKRNAKYAQLAGVKKIRIHDFRHSHVSILANSGINIQEIARRLGHAKIEITWNTYSHLYPHEEEKAVEILDTII